MGWLTAGSWHEWSGMPSTSVADPAPTESLLRAELGALDSTRAWSTCLRLSWEPSQFSPSLSSHLALSPSQGPPGLLCTGWVVSCVWACVCTASSLGMALPILSTLESMFFLEGWVPDTFSGRVPDHTLCPGAFPSPSSELPGHLHAHASIPGLARWTSAAPPLGRNSPRTGTSYAGPVYPPLTLEALFGPAGEALSRHTCLTSVLHCYRYFSVAPCSSGAQTGV